MESYKIALAIVKLRNAINQINSDVNRLRKELDILKQECEDNFKGDSLFRSEEKVFGPKKRRSYGQPNGLP